MGKAAYGWLSAVALGAWFALFQWQRIELDGLRQRVGLLEDELSEVRAEQQLVAARVAPVPRHPSTALSSAKASRTSGDTQGPGDESAAPADPTPSSPRRLFASPDDPDRRAAIASVVAVLDSDNPTVRHRVRNLVRQEQDAMWDERRQRRQAAWEERTSGRLSELAQQADLSQAQVDGLFAALTAGRDRIGEAFRNARENQSFGQAHEEAAKIRDEVDEEAGELLDEEQLSAYQQMRAEQRAERQRRHPRPPPPAPEP